MTDTDALIESLSEEARAIRPAASPWQLFIQWITASFLYVAALLLVFGLREDLAVKLQTPLFAAEIVLLVAMIITVGISATALSFPDLHQKRWLLRLPILPLVLFLGVLFLSWLADNPPSPKPVHGIECLLCITLLSLLPAVWMLFILRRQASTHYYLAGGTALLAASSMGCLALRLSEKTDSVIHLIEWHYLPMIGFGVIGLWLGRKFLKW